jgi:hypothetical protein
MKQFRGAALGLALGTTLAIAFGSTASAFAILTVSGNHGEWGSSSATADDAAHPGARCGYAAPDTSGFAHLAWIKVYPFKALAYNHSGATDSQPVTFMATVQRSTDGGTTWKNGASASQTRTAFDNKSPKFDTLKVAVSGKEGSLYRAVVTLKWLKNGHVDGLVKVRMEYYSVKWTVGDPAFVYSNACDGAAD